MLELSVAEAAKRLGVTARRVLQYIEEGRLAARKLSGIWLISAASLTEFQHQPAGRPAPPHKDAALARYEDGEPVAAIAANCETSEAAIYKLASRTGKYRKPERRAAYEAALELAADLDDVWRADAHLDIARQLDGELSREVRKQIAAKAVRVLRGRRRKEGIK